MRIKFVDGVCYERVVRAKKDSLECSSGVWKMLRIALEKDCYVAHSDKDEIRKRVIYSRFMLEHFGHMAAADSYEETLYLIKQIELKNRYPQHEVLALECAYALANRYCETDYDIDRSHIVDIEAFYAEHFPSRRGR